MPLTRTRLLPVPRSCLSFNGVNQYAVIGLQPNDSGTQFTVYGWSEITIEELIYPVWPKANTAWSKFSMIGEFSANNAATLIVTDNRTDYTYLGFRFTTRRPDGSITSYPYNILTFRNVWLHLVRRFTSSRELSYWMNGSRMYTATVPSTETTVLELDPDTSTYPSKYKRFVLAAETGFLDFMTVKYGYVRIYNRALTDEEIQWNFYYPDNPVRNGLVLWLHWDSIDTDVGIWYDKSGFGNHATLYNNPAIENVAKAPSRLLTPARILTPVR